MGWSAPGSRAKARGSSRRERSIEALAAGASYGLGNQGVDAPAARRAETGDARVGGQPGRRARNGRVWDGDVRARSRRWFNAGVSDDEIPGLQLGGSDIKSCDRPRLGGAARESTTPPVSILADTGGRVSSSRGRAGDPGLVGDLQLTG